MSVPQPITNLGIASFAPPPPMEGIPSLGGRQDIAEKLANMGQYDDDEIAHVAEGEVIVPAPIMKYYPEIKEQVFQAIREEGLDPNEFVVGDEVVARNPYTGMQEFGWLSKTWKKIKNVAKKALPYIAAAIGLYYAAPYFAATAGTAGTAGATTAGATAGGAGTAAATTAGVGTAAATAGSAAATTAKVGLGTKLATAGRAALNFAAANPGTAGFIGGTGAGLVQGKNLKDSLKLGLQVGATTGTLGNVFGTEGLAKLAGPQQTTGGIQSIFSTAPTNLNPATGRVRQLKGIPDTMSPQPSFFKQPGALGKTVDYASLGLIGTGLLTDPEEFADEPYEYEPTREGQAFPSLFYDPVTGQYSDIAPEGTRVIQGPIRRVNAGGAVAGPGTGTSDSIPAMLSDGEFVMTAKAVRGMGDGSREKGAAKMYQLMNRLEGKA